MNGGGSRVIFKLPVVLLWPPVFKFPDKMVPCESKWARPSILPDNQLLLPFNFSLKYASFVQNDPEDLYVIPSAPLVTTPFIETGPKLPLVPSYSPSEPTLTSRVSKSLRAEKEPDTRTFWSIETCPSHFILSCS